MSTAARVRPVALAAAPRNPHCRKGSGGCCGDPVNARAGRPSASYDGRMNLVTRLAGAVLHERSGRRRAGYASAAVLVLGWVLVQLAWLNPGRLLVLEPLSAERVTWVIWGAAAVLGVVTVLVGLRRRWGLPLAGVGVALVLLVAGVVAVNRHAHADTDPGYRQASEAVAAASPDGRLE